MPAKPKPAAPRSEDTERNDSGQSYSPDNPARRPVQKQPRASALPKQPPRARSVDDRIAAENAKAIRKASVRARRLGLH